MNRILTIFRKDARHLSLHIGAFLALLAVAAVADPTYSAEGSSYYWLVSDLLLPLSCWNLVVAAIHQEKLTGDRQYWLTRPCSWKDLLGAKLLFIVTFVNLPLLIWHVAALAWVGISLWNWLPVLIWRQILFSVLYIVPALVLAAVTRNLGQVILAGLTLVLPAIYFGPWLLFRPTRWIGLEWMAQPAIAAVFASGAAVVLVLQYSRRRTAMSRMIVLAVVLITALGMGFFPVQKAIAVERLLRSERPEIARIVLRPDSGALSFTSGRTWAAIRIPARIDGLPPGARLAASSATIEIESPGGAVYQVDAAWTSDSAISSRVSPRLVEIIRETPVDVSASLEFTVFGNSRKLPLPKDHPIRAPRVGVCSSRENLAGAIDFVCYTPLPQCSLSVLSSAQARNWIIPRGEADAHLTTAGGFQPLAKFSSQLTYRSWRDLEGASLNTEEPLARFRRTVRMRQVRFGYRALP